MDGPTDGVTESQGGYDRKIEAESRPLENLISRLDGVCTSGLGWSCQCPAHDDLHASLSVSEGEDGRVLVHCHAGCSVEEICAAVGLEVSDLYPQALPAEPAIVHGKKGVRRHKGDKEDWVTFVSENEAIADPPAQVKVVELPSQPERGDFVEWIDGRSEAAEPEVLRHQVDALIATTQPYRPARSAGGLTRYLPFPAHVLPHPLGDFVRAAARAIGCDLAFIVLPLLAALASAIGNTRRILLKAGWCEPSILWTAIVGESGSNKSGAITVGTAILNQLQGEALIDYQSRLESYEREKLEYDVALAEWKRAKPGKRGDPPEKPIEPVPRRLIVSDATIEALADRLVHAPRGLSLVRDELAGWFGSFDQYKSSKGGRRGALADAL